MVKPSFGETDTERGPLSSRSKTCRERVHSASDGEAIDKFKERE